MHTLDFHSIVYFSFMSKINENIRKIRGAKGYSQEIAAEMLRKTQSSYARIERGATKIDYEFLEQFASAMNMSVVDVIVFPDKYINITETENSNKESLKTVLQIEIPENKKDAILKLVLGENYLNQI
jgi:transcriptional regulator with XRE-family HTH domain